MKILFLTNMPSYHQSELSDAIVSIIGSENFRLVFYGDTSADRREMGWSDQYNAPYIIRHWESDKSANQTKYWIKEADVVIQGRFPTNLLRHRIRSGKLTFSCQERRWKKRPTALRLLGRLPHLIRNYWFVNRANFHFLAIGHSASKDLNQLGLFRGRSWKFGYFIQSQASNLVANSDVKDRALDQPISLLWCGRFSKVKQPLQAIKIVAGLQERGIPCHLTMIGEGEMRADIEQEIGHHGISQHVLLTGWQTAEQVKSYMQKAELYLMTSGRGEGWGLVLNEAMNASCAVAANIESGAAQWLVQDGKTGFLYDDANLDKLIDSIANCSQKTLIEMGEAGFTHVLKNWSADVAAKRLTALAASLLEELHGAHSSPRRLTAPSQKLFTNGPCSPDG